MCVIKVVHHPNKSEPSQHEPDWEESDEFLIFLNVEIFKYRASFRNPFRHCLNLSSHDDDQGQERYN
jgi:hypothetical protein